MGKNRVREQAIIRLRALSLIDEWLTFALLEVTIYMIWGYNALKWTLFIGAILSVISINVTNKIWVKRINSPHNEL